MVAHSNNVESNSQTTGKAAIQNELLDLFKLAQVQHHRDTDWSTLSERVERLPIPSLQHVLEIEQSLDTTHHLLSSFLRCLRSQRHIKGETAKGRVVCSWGCIGSRTNVVLDDMVLSDGKLILLCHSMLIVDIEIEVIELISLCVVARGTNVSLLHHSILLLFLILVVA